MPAVGIHLRSVVPPALVNALELFAVEGAMVLRNNLGAAVFFDEDACGD